VKVILTVIFLFAVGYGLMWAVLHYCTTLDDWAVSLLPVMLGTMFVLGSPYLKKKAGG